MGAHGYSIYYIYIMEIDMQRSEKDNFYKIKLTQL